MQSDLIPGFRQKPWFLLPFRLIYQEVRLNA